MADLQFTNGRSTPPGAIENREITPESLLEMFLKVIVNSRAAMGAVFDEDSNIITLPSQEAIEEQCSVALNSANELVVRAGDPETVFSEAVNKLGGSIKGTSRIITISFAKFLESFTTAKDIELLSLKADGQSVLACRYKYDNKPYLVIPGYSMPTIAPIEIGGQKQDFGNQWSKNHNIGLATEAKPNEGDRFKKSYLSSGPTFQAYVQDGVLHVTADVTVDGVHHFTASAYDETTAQAHAEAIASQKKFMMEASPIERAVSFDKDPENDLWQLSASLVHRADHQTGLAEMKAALDDSNPNKPEIKLS